MPTLSALNGGKLQRRHQYNDDKRGKGRSNAYNEMRDKEDKCRGRNESEPSSRSSSKPSDLDLIIDSNVDGSTLLREIWLDVERVA